MSGLMQFKNCLGCGLVTLMPNMEDNALSRYGHGEICSQCGVREAMEGDFISAKQKSMPQTFTIEVTKERFKILNTMMQATLLVPMDGFHAFIRAKGLEEKTAALFDEISDKGHAMNMCTDPGCTKAQPKDVQAL